MCWAGLLTCLLCLLAGLFLPPNIRSGLQPVSSFGQSTVTWWDWKFVLIIVIEMARIVRWTKNIFRWSLVNWPATATFTSLKWVGLHCGNCNYCTHRWNLCFYRDQTNVGGRGKQIRWQVDCSAEERWHSPSRSRQAFSLTGLSSRCWENLVLAMLGEQFMVGEEICGAVVSIRFQEDILRWGSVKGYSFCKFFPKLFFCSIWNRTACDQAVTNRIRDTFRRVLIFHVISYFWIDGFCLFTADLTQVLSLPTGTAIEYKAHNDSLKWVWFCSDLGILFAKARGVWNSWVTFELSILKTSVQLRIVLMGLFVGNIQGLEQNQSSGETW